MSAESWLCLLKLKLICFCVYSLRGTITAVLCLPLVFFGRDPSLRQLQEDITVDWTCVAIGFSSGFIEFYDEVRHDFLAVQSLSCSLKLILCALIFCLNFFPRMETYFLSSSHARNQF